MDASTFRSGYVSIIGKPNVGKSTLLNTILGQKIAIVSPRPQTTRHQFAGILTRDAYQIVFLDTPGLLDPHYQLHHYMLKAALGSLEDTDLIIYMVDVHEKPDRLVEHIPKKAKFIFSKKLAGKRLLVINKVDLIEKPKLLPLIAGYHALELFDEILPVAALHNVEVEHLVDVIIRYLPQGPPFFPEDQISDVTERFVASELIREKVFLSTHDEIPYSTTVQVETFKDRGTKIYIRANILVLKNSQKGVLIGKGGQMLRRIGSEARKDLEEFLEKPVYLDLWVKVRKDWRKNPRYLDYLGYGLKA